MRASSIDRATAGREGWDLNVMFGSCMHSWAELRGQGLALWRALALPLPRRLPSLQASSSSCTYAPRENIATSMPPVLRVTFLTRGRAESEDKEREARNDSQENLPA
jgi:hypothetical protein